MVSMDLEEEMELIRIRQQELIVLGGNDREAWRLLIVWEYLRDKLLIATQGNGRIH